MEEVTWTSESRVKPLAMTEKTAELRSYALKEKG